MKFDELTTEAVSQLPNEELLSLHFRCHQLAAGEFCERALEVHDDVIMPEMAKRKIKHTSPLRCHDEKSLKPPADVVKAAQRGLELYEAGHGGEGLEKETVEWARRVAKGEPVTRAKAEQGYRWHARNARFAKAPDESPMGTAWWLWFGKAGKRWFAELWGEKGRGLYLVEPHGELIAKGRSKAIAKDRRLDLEGEWILVSDQFAWGGMMIGEPEKVSLEEFDKCYGEKHHIGKKERLQWWPLAEDLWLYPVESFEPYEQPKKVIVPPGTQTVMRGIEFAEKVRSDDVIQKLDSIPDKFVWIPDFVSVTGSTIYAKDREPHDIDVVLRAESDGDGYAIKLPIDAGFAIKLERVLEDALDGKSVQYVPSEYGPNWTALPIYDLCLVKREPLKLMEIGEREPEFVEMEYKGRWVTIRGKPVYIGGVASISKRVRIGSAPEKLYGHYGVRKPSEEEKVKFIKSLDEFPNEIQELWHDDSPDPILAIAPDSLTAYHHGRWVVVPDGSPEGLVAQHEFLHHIVGQGYITQKLGAYKPKKVFAHAGENKNEDLTMTLNCFHPNRTKWAENLGKTGERIMHGKSISLKEAHDKVSEADRFIKFVGGW